MNGTKTCSFCGNELPKTCFYRRKSSKDGLMSECKKCNNTRHREYYKKHKKHYAKIHNEYYHNNIKSIRTRTQQYFLENKQKLYKKRKIWERKNKDKVREYHRRYNQEHRKERAKYMQHYRISNPKNFFKYRIRKAILYSFKKKGCSKSAHTEQIVGCSLSDLYTYLLSTWEERYGSPWNGEPYHIDHIIPLKIARSRSEIVKLCHYSNLQLLTPEDNLRKGAKLKDRKTTTRTSSKLSLF